MKWCKGSENDKLEGALREPLCYKITIWLIPPSCSPTKKLQVRDSGTVEAW